MNIRIYLTVFVFSLGFMLNAQTDVEKGEIKDVRDGNIYQTVKIEDRVWLAENMRFITDAVAIFNPQNSGAIEELYFYPYEEADEVCPEGFELPKESDWEAYMDYWFETNEIPDSIIYPLSVSKKRVVGNGIFTAHTMVLFFEGYNPLNLRTSGMVENDKLLWNSSKGALTFWTRKDAPGDETYHVHIQSDGAINHAHDHHIKTKRKRKKRKFVIRCVKQVEKTKS